MPCKYAIFFSYLCWLLPFLKDAINYNIFFFLRKKTFTGKEFEFWAMQSEHSITALVPQLLSLKWFLNFEAKITI